MNISYVNENDPEGPEVKVVDVHPAQRPAGIPELDGEPYTQFIRLSCGHGVFNTFGNHFQTKFVGDVMKCYLCGEKQSNGKS